MEIFTRNTHDSPTETQTAEIFKRTINIVKNNIESVIVGKSEAVDLLLICLLCGGHVLIEDVPGLGKTSMVMALAGSIDCAFQRVQFTPDTLPSDVTGFTMYHPVTGEQRFYPGAVMSQILLADELNRTSPKTQSALLQAMQEGRVTVDGVTHDLPNIFMVCATQNPSEQAGTYPLPEAQLDRFLMRVSMGYPDRNDEITILSRNKKGGKMPKVSAVTNADGVILMQKALDEITCSRSIMSYIVDIVRNIRQHKDVALGVSTRGSVALMRTSMGRALFLGRSYVIPDDVQAMASPTLCHRIMLRAQAYTQNQSAEKILNEVLNITPVPVVSRS